MALISRSLSAHLRAVLNVEDPFNKDSRVDKLAPTLAILTLSIISQSQSLDALN